jgi:hypothetical protein
MKKVLFFSVNISDTVVTEESRTGCLSITTHPTAKPEHWHGASERLARRLLILAVSPLAVSGG